MAVPNDDGNPFRPSEPAKKRIINLSVTAAQMDAVDSLQQSLSLESRSAVLKHALAELIDRGAPDGR